MGNLDPVEIKAFLPAKDFARSAQFYQDLGFTLCWGGDGDLAYFHWGDHGDHAKRGFLLQRFYVKEHAENFAMHLLVADVDAWWAKSGTRNYRRSTACTRSRPRISPGDATSSCSTPPG